MKNTISGILVGLIVGVLATWAFLKNPHEKEPEKKEEHKEEARVQHGTNGEVFLKLDKETQEHCGLKIGALEPVEVRPELKAFGRVVDPALLVSQLVDINSAQAALEASRKEFERLKVLHSQNQNVSTRSLEVAEAAVKRDQIMLAATQAKLALAWGKAIAERKDLTNFVESLISLRTALVRIDLPAGETVTSLPISARIAPITAQREFLDSKFLGLTTTADPQVQGQGFLFFVNTNSLLPGATVIAYVMLPGKPRTGVFVPNSALIRYEGETFIYLQKAEDRFQREEVKLDVPQQDGWLVTSDRSAGEKIVLSGAQQLLSEELKSRSAEE